MNNPSTKFKSGDLVRVKSAKEILSTLDAKGCLDGLPFMEEMIPFCGNQFKVLYRVEKTCRDTTDSMTVSEFIHNNVIYLENVRCSGNNHGGCQRGCMIFWKEDWLELVENSGESIVLDDEDINKLKDRLLTFTDIAIYFCQSTALKNSVIDLNKYQRLKKIFVDVKSGTYTFTKAMSLIFVPIFRKIYKKIHDFQPRGRLNLTPDEILNLKSGEMVEVKSLKEILKTLDKYGKNKGLEFSPDMKDLCGKRFRVRNRLDKMIIERSGRLREVKNTVILENVTCNCFYAFGGCPRKEFQYWREIWLKRV